MIFEVTDPLGRAVRLTARTMGDHISVRHTIVTDDAVKRTVQGPEVVMRSQRDQTCDVYFLRGADPNHYALYCKVVVSFSETHSGTVLTAMYTDKIGGVRGVRYMQVSNRSY